MNRYLSFVGRKDYPSRGWQSFAGAFDTVDTCKEHLAEIAARTFTTWAQIVDGSGDLGKGIIAQAKIEYPVKRMIKVGRDDKPIIIWREVLKKDANLLQEKRS